MIILKDCIQPLIQVQDPIYNPVSFLLVRGCYGGATTRHSQSLRSTTAYFSNKISGIAHEKYCGLSQDFQPVPVRCWATQTAIYKHLTSPLSWLWRILQRENLNQNIEFIENDEKCVSFSLQWNNIQPEKKLQNKMKPDHFIEKP